MKVTILQITCRAASSYIPKTEAPPESHDGDRVLDITVNMLKLLSNTMLPMGGAGTEIAKKCMKTCISWIMNMSDHLFIHLCISCPFVMLLSVKYLLMSLAHLSIVCLFQLELEAFFVYPDTNHLLVRCAMNTFSHFMVCLFTILRVFLFKNLIKSSKLLTILNLLFFSFMVNVYVFC